ncbi:TetR/AcrR family transcriptional regulator [Duganella sp. PWIR1]
MKKNAPPPVSKNSAQVRRPGRPKGLDAVAIEAQIIDAAKRLFFAQGLSSTSMDAVAKAAGITKQTLYARFPSKGELYQAVIDHTMVQWREQQGPLLGKFKSLEASLYHHSVGTLETATREGSALLANFLNLEAGHNPELVRQIMGPVRAKAIQDIETILAAFPGPNRITAATRRAAAEYFFMCLVGKIHDLNHFRDEIRPAALATWAKTTVRLFLDGYQART